MTTPAQIDPRGLILLAGGGSRRMGSDKWALDWFGQPLIVSMLSGLAPMFESRVVVTAPGRRPEGLPTNVQLISDPVALAGEGPLVAAMAGLAELDRLGCVDAFLTGCDMPLLRVADLQFLHRAFRRRGGAALLPLDSGAGRKGSHPLCAWLNISRMRTRIEALVEGGERRLRAAFDIDAEGIDVATLPNPRAILGCNSIEEYEQLRAEARGPIRRA